LKQSRETKGDEREERREEEESDEDVVDRKGIPCGNIPRPITADKPLLSIGKESKELKDMAPSTPGMADNDDDYDYDDFPLLGAAGLISEGRRQATRQQQSRAWLQLRRPRPTHRCFR